MLAETLRTCLAVFKIVIPIALLVRLLQETGIVDHIGRALSPVMKLVGLPGEMGLVWATALLTNLYAAMVVFVNLLGDLDPPITVAQTTVLTTMLLVAHGMPVELRICQKAGPRIRVMMLVRIIGALVLGWILYKVYALGGWASLDVTNTPLWEGGSRDPSWSGWAIAQGWLMLKIVIIILALLTVMKLLEFFGVTAAMNRSLEPLLRLLGMTPAAAPLAVIGMTLGITYGGGLIIRQAQSGRLGKRDIFYSLVLMSLCHSIVEDLCAVRRRIQGDERPARLCNLFCGSPLRGPSRRRESSDSVS